VGVDTSRPRCTLIALAALVALLGMFSMPSRAETGIETPRQIQTTVEVDAPPEVVWDHWTTLSGLNALFMAATPPLEGRIAIEPGGAYELYFSNALPEGSRGTEGSRVLSVQHGKMLGFSWRNNPQWPALRPYYTYVVVQLEPIGDSRTKVQLTQLGFGEGSDWDEMYGYFESAWSRVLGRLKDRYSSGTRE
jgi:uncharacterized protein YndB with AHSA1/START domain